MKTIVKSAVILTTSLLTLPAYAHHAMDGMMPTNFAQGMLSGLAHPIIGLDHLAFVLLVGLLVAAISGAAKYLVPGAFVAAAIIGTGIHMMSINLPIPELVIAFSVLSAGLLAMLRKQLPTFLLGLGVAGFGLFHGYAYGESVIGAETSPIIAYLIGFSLIQYALIVAVGFGMNKLAASSERVQNIVSRSTAVAGAALGAFFLVSNFA